MAGRAGRAAAAALAASLLALLPDGARAALSVMPHRSDGIVMQLRSAIMFDEKDLTGPLRPAVCSSLDDGPHCARLSLAGGPGVAAGSPAAEGSFFFGDGRHSGAHYVVDGVLSSQMQARNKDAFAWSPETFHTFSSLVSKVIIDSLGKAEDITKGGSLKMGDSLVSAATRSGSQCFRLAFNRLRPGEAYLPRDFSAGLPKAVGISWEGQWEVDEASPGSARRPRMPPRADGLRLPWATVVRLRTHIYIYIYIYIYIHMHTYIHTYILYIYIEREREI